MRMIILLGAMALASAATARPQKTEPAPPGPPKENAGQVMGDIATQPLQDLNVKNKRKAAAGKIEKIMWTDIPAAIAYRYNYLGGFSKTFTGVQFTALGHTLFGKAAKA